MTTPSDFLVWQLADSAFPTGGFAHSGGLEAAWQLGLVPRGGLSSFIAAALEHAVAGALPLAMGAHDAPDEFHALDALADAMLSSHVANRASRAQGAAMLASATAAFGLPVLATLRGQCVEREAPQHLAPAFGVVTQALGVARPAAARLFVFIALRGLLSSSVRLGALGPLAAQGLQHSLAAVAEALAAAHERRAPDEAAQTSPLVELVQAEQDRLYSRLFSS